VTMANRVPAPVGGIDARTILSAGDPMFCIYAFNLLPSEYGMTVRKGYREWVIDLDNGNPLGVGTIIPYGGLDDDSTNDRLFAVTNEGIWDVTTPAVPPVLVLDFLDPGNGGITTAAAGKGVYAPYRTDAMPPADAVLFYADSENGLFTYREDTDTWARTTGITGPVIEDVVFVMSHKEQLWLVEKDQSKAWYLPAGQVGGVADEQFFGSNYKHGGDTAGLFSWTIDGGAGVDDYLVVVSRSGDVLVWQGNDPSNVDDWFLQGQYFIGAIPTGNRFATENGGNLNLLSIYGLTAMDEIIRGVDGKNINAQTESAKIAVVIRQAMERYRDNDGWDVKLLPAQGTILISQPVQDDGVYLQYALNTVTSGWGIWRDVPIEAFDEWNGNVYLGTLDNRIMVMDVNVDNALITPVASPNGLPINFSVLTSFQDYGQPAQFKRGKYIRPDFLSDQQPSFTANFRYDYDLSEILNTDSNPLTVGSFWDFGLWNSAIWNGDRLTGFNRISGGWGLGRAVAIAMSGKSITRTTLVAWGS